MSKFNKTKTIKTENRAGHVAYKMADREHLVTAVLTSFFGENKFYGSTDNDIVRLAVSCAEHDPKFLAQLAIYARQEANMRSVSHVLASVIARYANEYTRPVIRQIIVRPDDITEIMSCYKAMYGKPFPNAMKREVGLALQKFDEYQLAKYNGNGKELSLRDVLRIAHPRPKNDTVATLFGKVLRDELETPYTWETELSAYGNNKETWDRLIASGKLGYMAMLRNLRNIAKSGADMEPVIRRIGDPIQVKRSRQLPFRFYSAYKELKNAGCMTPELFRALESAVNASTDCMERIGGRTIIAIDNSGSMSWTNSARGTITAIEIGSLIGCMAARMCEDATVIFFNTDYKVKRFGPLESVLENCLNNSDARGGTNMNLPMQWAFYSDPHVALKPFDRIIYFSDNQCNAQRGAVQLWASQYRNTYNSNFWVHAVDLQGYGTQQFYGDHFNLIAGWSDKVLPFINLAECGMGSLINTISKIAI